MSDVYRHSDGSWRDYAELATYEPSAVMLVEPGKNYTVTVANTNDIHTNDTLNQNKGSKHDNGKAPIHMIPEDAILGMAEAFAYGAKKYDRFNYRKGIDLTRLTDSLMRHVLAYLKGEDIDPESGLHHTKHILANAAMIEFVRINRPEHDDRYKDGKD